jgi:hypothetical protein
MTKGGDEWVMENTFLNLIVASSEYESFLQLMAGEAANLPEADAGGDSEEKSGK